MNTSSALRELRYNGTRTFLSLLGVSIGIFCIVGVFTLVDSLKRNINESLSSLGNDVLYVNKFAWMPEEGEKEYPFWKYKSRPQNKLREVKLIKETIPSVAYAAIANKDFTKVQFLDHQKIDVNINAVSYDFIHVQSFDIANGRYFTTHEMDGITNGVLIGNDVKENLFANINPIGKVLKLYDRAVVVIGVLRKNGQDVTGFDLDNSILCSYNFIHSFINIEDDKLEFQDNTIMIRPRKGINVTDMKYEIKGALRATRRISPGKEDNFSFNLLSNIQKGIESIFGIVNLAGFCIGILSLLVGAFGIANIMFVSVKERTSLIGLKKAIGAKRSTIITEFLMESIFLCLAGGLIGIVLVMILAKIINANADFPVALSINNFLFGVGISVVVGILSGIFPALKASSLNPVVAIRS